MKLFKLRLVRFAVALWAATQLPGPVCTADDQPSRASDVKASKSAAASGSIDLLKPSTFAECWKSTDYGGEGEVVFEDGVLTLKTGDPLTGVTYQKEFPKTNYEIRWKAKRVSGHDFFSCLTFPIGEEHCSVVAGGWGGGVVGLSSIDGYDASENETTQFLEFENDHWYDFRLRVTDEVVEFYVDGDQILDVQREGHKFSTRIEVHRNTPLGIAAFQCVAQIKDWTYSRIGDGEERAAAGGETQQFMRVVEERGGPERLETAVASYRFTDGPLKGSTVDLIGAVHVGERSYYQELNKRFADYDAVLFELVADPEYRMPGRKDREGVINPVSSLQVALKDSLELEFQLDEVDYEAKNFVHADMTPAEFMADMRKRKDSFASMFARVLGSAIAAQATHGNQDAALMAAMLAPDRAMAMRRVMAAQFERAEVEMAGLQDASGRSTLVTERNNKALDVMRQRLEAGDRKVAIFYGAAHLPDMHEKLLERFNAEHTGTEWLTAWKLR